jgi:hypothetical protein
MSDMVALLLVRAFAVNANIEAMKVENENRRRKNECDAWNEESFFVEAKELNSIADTMRNYI